MKEALLEEEHRQEEGRVVEAERRQEAEASGLAGSASRVDNDWETDSTAGDEEDSGDWNAEGEQCGCRYVEGGTWSVAERPSRPP